MSRSFEEAQEEVHERRLNEHVAQQLGISIEILDEHPYQIEEVSGDNADNEGVVYGWRVMWDDVPPEGIAVHGAEGSQWSDISAAPDGPNPEDFS
jgi:hypothetical protein